MSVTPLLLYLFDEASSGTTPTDVHDTSAGTAVDLAISYDDGAWTSIAAGDGLYYGVTQFTQSLSSTLSGTKVATALTGSKQATMEIVFSGSSGVTPSSGNDVFGIYSEAFELKTQASGGLYGIWGGGVLGGTLGVINSGADMFSSGTVYVLHLVVDTTQAVQDDRCKAYINGSPVSCTGGSVDQDTTIDETSPGLSTNIVVAGLGVEGINVYYAALFSTTLSAGDCSTRATALLANNDAAPAGDPPVITVQPADQTVLLGNTATFTVTATGTGTLHYQWKDDGSNVGTDSSSYTTAASTLSDNGAIITVDVTDDNGTTVSSNAHWYVINVATLAWFRF